MIATATVQTTRAARYMKALCNHFGSKVAATHEGDQGSVAFPFGTCEMTAQTETLLITVQANDAASLAQTQNIVQRHLEKFAEKEAVQVEWQEVTGS